MYECLQEFVPMSCDLYKMRICMNLNCEFLKYELFQQNDILHINAICVYSSSRLVVQWYLAATI